MRLRTKLVEEAVVGTLGVGAAALGESRLRRMINGSADDANGSYERDECGGERYHSGRLGVKLRLSATTIRRSVLGESGEDSDVLRF